MAIAVSAPVLLNQKKSVAKSPDSLTHPVHVPSIHLTSKLNNALINEMKLLCIGKWRRVFW